MGFMHASNGLGRSAQSGPGACTQPPRTRYHRSRTNRLKRSAEPFARLLRGRPASSRAWCFAGLLGLLARSAATGASPGWRSVRLGPCLVFRRTGPPAPSADLPISAFCCLYCLDTANHHGALAAHPTIT